MSNSPDDPRTVAMNPDAPMDERRDALEQLQKTHRALASDLIPADELQPVFDYIQQGLADANLAKAAKVIPFPTAHKKKTQRGPQSVTVDKFQVVANGEYWERPAGLSFETLRQMVDQTPILSAVVMTRCRQVARFCQPRETDTGEGFEIRHIDKDHRLDTEEEESIRLLTRFAQNSGWEFKPRRRQRLKRDSMSNFMSKIVRDTLTLDAAAIETEYKRDRERGIDGFYAVDGGTVRLCTEDGYEGDDEIFALQVVEGRISTAYTYDDLIYVPRNPRTDVRMAGYGLPEPELLIRVVTGFLNAMTYNIAGFDKNAIPKGMLHLVGEYDNNDLVAFKRFWKAMTEGINNAWTMPVMVSKTPEGKASFEKFGIDFDEMYFSKWMTFLTSIICAIYGMSPDEINFESFTAGRSALSGSDTEEKLASSKDKGFKPLLSYLQSIMSDYIIGDFSEKFVFRWVGLEGEDEEKKHELLKLTSSINEIRTRQGDEPTDAIWGEAPANPSLVGVWQQSLQQQQEDYGDPGDEGAPGAEDAGPGQDDPGSQDAGADDDREQEGPPDADEQGPDFGQPDVAASGDFGKSLSVGFPTIYTIG